MSTPLERTRDAFDFFTDSQLLMERPSQMVDVNYSTLAVWNAHQGRRMPALIATRKLDLGTSRVKNFRTVILHGDGDCFVTVVVDGRIVVPRARITLREGPASPATIRLPRGTAGKWILLEIVGQVIPESFDIDWALIV